MSINRSFPFPFSLFSLLFSLRSSFIHSLKFCCFFFFLCVVVFVVCVVIVVVWGSSSPSSSSEGKVVPLLARPVERA